MKKRLTYIMLRYPHFFKTYAFEFLSNDNNIKEMCMQSNI